MFRITKTFRFEAAHQLPQMPDGHKCKRLHGHSYRVQLVFDSPALADGMVFDYGDLDPFKDWLALDVDHRNLGELVPGGDSHTTAECLARWFATQVKLILPEHVTKFLHQVAVSETDNTWAIWRLERLEVQR